jgi:hypothetical protein
MSDTSGAVVTRTGALDMHVCVPGGWTDDRIKTLAGTENVCGTMVGWQIRKDAKMLNGSPECNPCSDRNGFVHVTLDA